MQVHLLVDVDALSVSLCHSLTHTRSLRNASNTTHCCSTLFNSVPKVALLFLTRVC